MVIRFVMHFRVLILVAAVACVSCARPLSSPGGAVTASVDGQTINVSYKGSGTSAGEVVHAATIHVGLVTKDIDLDSGLKLKKVSSKTKVVDDYDMVSGKRKHCHNEASERVYRYLNPDGAVLDVAVRVYDDGVAIRYILPGRVDVVEDCTAYTIPDGTKRWISPLKTDYEAFFPLSTDGGPTGERMWPRPEPGRWAYPALAEPADGVFTLISEADLRHGDSASSLDNSADPATYRVRLTGPATFEDGKSPWRFVIIGPLSTIVESTLVTDLSSPAAFDPDWVKPGVSSWVYWAYNHGSKDFNRNVEFIDLAADMGWPYCLVDWEWPQMDNGDIEEVLDYAGEKGVKLNLWYNSGTSWVGDGAPQPQDCIVDPKNRAKELDWLESRGVNGIKVDFFLPDDAEMVDYYLDILEDAAAHHLTVDFHGCTVPRGWQRTWPNMVSMESVYGAEWYNNGPAMTTRAAAHNATIPFTRNVIGPMDYTPGTFSDSQFPHITTYAHELALPILFESGIQHMPDRPDIYYGLPEEVRNLLSGLPAAWEDTRLLAGYPGDSAVIARKSEGRWYIAGINGLDEAREIEVPLTRPGLEGAEFKLFGDGSEDREFLIKDITAGQTVTVPCRARGGFVLVSE